MIQLWRISCRKSRVSFQLRVVCPAIFRLTLDEKLRPGKLPGKCISSYWQPMEEIFLAFVQRAKRKKIKTTQKLRRCSTFGSASAVHAAMRLISGARARDNSHCGRPERFSFLSCSCSCLLPEAVLVHRTPNSLYLALHRFRGV